MQDAIRDLHDIGAGHIEVINIVKTAPGTKLDAGKQGFKEGVIFSTYMVRSPFLLCPLPHGHCVAQRGSTPRRAHSRLCSPLALPHAPPASIAGPRLQVTEGDAREADHPVARRRQLRWLHALR